MDRTNLVQEPGLLQFNSQTFYSAGPIVATLIGDRFDIPSDQFGVVDRRDSDRRIEITFTPVGELEALATLFPHGGATFGSSVFGATDTPATIYTPSGKSLEVHNCAVTSQPTLNFGHDRTLFGEVTITGLLKKGGAPEDANAYYTYTASGAVYPGDTAFSASAIKTLGYKGAWGSAPWDEIFFEQGLTINHNVGMESKFVDGYGTVDMIINSSEATAQGTPVEISPSDLEAKLQYQGSGNELGARQASGDDLIITNRVGSTQLHVQLYGAVLETPKTLNYSAAQNAVGQLTWRATREFATGTAEPLFYIGTSAPA